MNIPVAPRVGRFTWNRFLRCLAGAMAAVVVGWVLSFALLPVAVRVVVPIRWLAMFVAGALGSVVGGTAWSPVIVFGVSALCFGVGYLMKAGMGVIVFALFVDPTLLLGGLLGPTIWARMHVPTSDK